MARKTPRDTIVLPVRVPRAFGEQVKRIADGNVSVWITRAIEAFMHVPGRSSVGRPPGWDEGRRAGWHAANVAFREALAAASERLKGLQP
jgi:hypothetical protein